MEHTDSLYNQIYVRQLNEHLAYWKGSEEYLLKDFYMPLENSLKIVSTCINFIIYA